MNTPEKIKVAAAQIRAFGLEQAEQSLTAVTRAVQQAGEAEVDLLVLPECAYPAYLIHSVAAYRAADVLPPSEYLITLARLARKNKLHIVSGYIEDVGTHLYNSAVLIDSAGQEVGTYRKSFLWAADNTYFKPGERIPVFETALGRIGIVICADTRAPEIIARQVTGGAQIIAMPTCWVNVAAETGQFENPQPEFLISARAREFDVPFVCANKYGMETAQVGYCGRSLIADHTGAPLAEAPGDAETLLVEEIELPQREPGPASQAWATLVDRKEPIRPTPKVLDPVSVAVWPGGPIAADDVERMRSRGMRLLVVSDVPAAPVADDDRLDMLTPDHVDTELDVAIGKVGCVAGAEFRRFERARLLALAGAEIICVFDAPDDLRLMRARAIENRTFILAVGREVGAIVAPGGEVLAYSSKACDDALTAELNVADAAVKTVAPHTDIWEQRRVDTYT